jgi:heme O synthase-like polyprenyltransferase
MLFLAGDFVRTRTATSARRLFFASIIYLPLLLGALVAFRL